MQNKNNKRVTLKQIAEETGYAVITVSKALRDEKDISLETKQVIREKADEMGYIRNVAASALRTGKSGMIAVSVIDIVNPYWAIFCKIMEKLALERNYIVVFMNGDPTSGREKQEISMMIQRGIDGIILDPSANCEESLDMLEQNGVPYVLLGDSFGERDSVSFEDDQRGYIAGKRFVRRGSKKILFMDIPEPYKPNTDREMGMRRALEEANFPMENLIYCRMKAGQGAPSGFVADIFHEHPDIDAIYAFHDYSALQLISVIESFGKRIPEDVAIISNDYIQHYFEVGRKLTTLDSSPERSAAEAFRLLFKRIDGDYDDYPKKIKLPVLLLEGQTC